MIFNQVLSQKKSVEMQMDELKLYKTQLEYTKDDFDRRNKILILEVSERFNNIEMNLGGKILSSLLEIQTILNT